MKKIWEFVKTHYEIFIYCVLVTLLFGACFFPVFAWLTGVYVITIALIWHDESKLLGLMLFLVCFQQIASYQKLFGLTVGELLVGFLILELGVLYLCRVVKHEFKLNWRTLIPIALFLVYIVLPFHECSWQSFAVKLIFFLLLYVVFEERKQIDYCYIVRLLVLGLVVSCLFVLFRDLSPLMIDNIKIFYYGSGARFHGLMAHPNVLARFLMLTICAILILKYKNKISIIEFLIEFIPMFVFGYLTISRMFIVALAVGLGIFGVLDLVKHRVKALPFLTTILLIICIIGGIFFNTTKMYLDKISINTLDTTEINMNLTTTNLDELFAGKSEQWRQDVFEGKIRFDPGRSGLREMYLSDWSSSPKTIWLGRGISRAKIGQMNAHNLLIQELWEHGLVGFIFYTLIICGAINWKKMKSIKQLLSFLIIFIPYFLTTLIEPCINDCFYLVLLIVAVGLREQVTEDKTSSNYVYTEKVDIDENK